MVSDQMSINDFPVKDNASSQEKDSAKSKLSSIEEKPEKQEHTASAEPVSDEENVAPPWHFKLLVIGTVGYLIYRFIWLIFLLTGHAWNG